jgi:alpha-glucosidase
MRQAPGAPQVIVTMNFTAERQIVDLTIGGAGMHAPKLKTLLITPGAADPVALNRIELAPYGVYIGEIQ